MTHIKSIYDIRRKAKEHFEKLKVPFKNNESAIVKMTGSEVYLSASGKWEAYQKLHLERFMSKAFELMEWVVPEEELHFIEDEPNAYRDKEHGTQFSFLSAHKAWEKRRDEFEPLFTKLPAFSEGKGRLSYLRVKDILKDGYKLNPSHPRLIKMNWSEIIGE